MTPSPFTHPSALDGSFPWVARGAAQVHRVYKKSTIAELAAGACPIM